MKILLWGDYGGTPRPKVGSIGVRSRCNNSFHIEMIIKISAMIFPLMLMAEIF